MTLVGKWSMTILAPVFSLGLVSVDRVVHMLFESCWLPAIYDLHDLLNLDWIRFPTKVTTILTICLLILDSFVVLTDRDCDALASIVWIVKLGRFDARLQKESRCFDIFPNRLNSIVIVGSKCLFELDSGDVAVTYWLKTQILFNFF